jgi:beta-lactamase superfamily II metal-dependent hydrolase
LVLLAVLSGVRPAAAQPVPASCFEARFLDVGQGDAVVVRPAEGPALVVDAGPSAAAAARVVAAVRSASGETPFVVFTHPHADHIGGARALLAAVRAARILDPGFPFASRVYRALLEAIVAHGPQLERARRGDRFALGARVAVEVLAPEEPLVRRSRSDANANSVVLRVSCGRIDLLLAGDAERVTERRLLLGGPDTLASEILKVAHHGSRYATTPDFLAAVRPEIAVISCGRGNRYRHPAPATVARLRAAGARVLRTDESGDVVVRTDGDRVEAIPAR